MLILRTCSLFLLCFLSSNAQRERYRIWDASYGNLSCFSCSSDFRWLPFNISDSCLGLIEAVDRTNLVRCGPTEIYCKEEFLVSNGILWTLTRQCTSLCYYGCRPRGFGIEHTTCSNCCSQHGCNGKPPDLSLQYSSATRGKMTVTIAEPWTIVFILVVMTTNWISKSTSF